MQNKIVKRTNKMRSLTSRLTSVSVDTSRHEKDAKTEVDETQIDTAKMEEHLNDISRG